MAKFPRHKANATMTLTSKTPSSKTGLGEVIYSTSTTEDQVLIQYGEQLEDPPGAGNLPLRMITAYSDPRKLSPRVDDLATIAGVDYRVVRVNATFWKGENIADRVLLQEKP